MVDVTITRAYREDYSIKVIGTGFTRTTTTVALDGVEQGFVWISDSELELDPLDGTEVTATKNGITATATIEEEPDMSDEPAGGSAGNTQSSTTLSPATISADDAKTEQEKEGMGPAADAVPIGVVAAEPVPVGSKEPYPTGNPPSPEAAKAAMEGKTI